MRKAIALYLLLSSCVYALAQMGPVFNPMLPLKPAATLSYQTEVSSGSANTTYSFSNVSIGTALPSRCVILSLAGKATTVTGILVSSALIAQYATATAIDFSEGSAGTGYAGIIMARVPAGTNANLAITFSAQLDRVAVGVWAAYNLPNCTPFSTQFSSASPGVVSMNSKFGDLMVATAFNNTGTSMAWTGATERFDDAGIGANAGGADTTTTVLNETPHALSVTYTGGPSRQAAVSALWR